MTNRHLRELLRQLRKLAGSTGAGSLTDSELLERFLSRRDEAAFEVLVWRHGPMVLNVCRRIVHQEQDAEDAFQATFLALVRKASSIGKRTALGSWLYKVAYRAALAAKAAATRRARREKQGLDLAVVTSRHDPIWSDLRPVLDAEVNRLPEKYRVPFVLCYLEGLTVDETAQQLGWPRGTVAT
ncbi:MAG: RNA polymerase sigma factor, partial [Gemmataceae bacterium]|nr:RNA polymerase sigma factor [Gemmataceae bacterium]